MGTLECVCIAGYKRVDVSSSMVLHEYLQFTVVSLLIDCNNLRVILYSLQNARFFCSSKRSDSLVRHRRLPALNFMMSKQGHKTR
jgi:hypothetical protein